MDTKRMAKMSSELLVIYHQNKPVPFERYLAPNAMWFGPGVGHVISGKEQIIRVWESRERPIPLSINEPDVHAVALGSHACNVIMVFATDMRFAGGEDTLLFRRVLLSWIESSSDAQPQVVLVESANLYIPNDEKRIFPLRYDTSGGVDKTKSFSTSVMLTGTDRSVYLIPARNIVWIETAVSGRKCLVHTIQGNYEILGSISQMEKKYPDSFLRTHISYLVNPYYIKELKRFRVILSDGTELPVPEKKYTAIKQRLAELF